MEVEGCRIEVGIAGAFRQREERNRFCGRIDAHDGVEAAVGDPGRAVRPDNHAVGPRAAAEMNVARVARVRIQDTQRFLVLGGVPDDTVFAGGRRDVVGMRTIRDGEFLQRHVFRRRHLR